MDFAKCWSCSEGFVFSWVDVWVCAILALFAFDIALVIYRLWRRRQTDLPRYFAPIGSRGGSANRPLGAPSPVAGSRESSLERGA